MPNAKRASMREGPLAALFRKTAEQTGLPEGQARGRAELNDGALKLTAAGHAFAASDTDERKRLFNEHLLRFVPLTAHICRVLRERQGGMAPRMRFEMELEDHLTSKDAERTLRAITAWGRYAELFAYDDKSGTFSTFAPAE